MSYIVVRTGARDKMMMTDVRQVVSSKYFVAETKEDAACKKRGYKMFPGSTVCVIQCNKK